MVRALLALLVSTNLAHGAPIDVTYVAYGAGIPVVTVKAEFDVANAYYVKLSYRTMGTANMLLHAAQQTSVEGQFAPDGHPQPARLISTGVLRGEPRVTQIDYRAGQPHIRQMSPPPEEERELVPDAQQANTIDSLSAMAELVRRMNTTGKCEGRATTFDGRRLAELEARTGGRDMLEQTTRSVFTGPAVRCDFTGHQIAGFRHDSDGREREMQHGSAWFAAVTPGGPLIPVRISFHTRWFGEAVMYLAPG